MATEAMIIEGRDRTVVVEGDEAFLVRPSGRRRSLGVYEGMKINHANGESEEAHIHVQTWVNPNYGPVRRALITTNLNSFIFPIEGLMKPPTYTFRIAGPISSRMIPASGKAA